MQRILNWGLLSTAKINQALIKPLRTSKRNHLLGVASRETASSQAYAKEWNIPRAYGSYEAMLADPEIHVVYNSLPNHMHAEWSIKALEAGKHVLCEKPMALSLSEVQDMAKAARSSDKVLTEAFMYRHHDQTIKVKQLIDDGMVGKLLLVKGKFTFPLTRAGNYRNFKEMGGGSIWDVGCYPISYSRMIIGAEPLEVFGWQVLGPGGGDEVFAGQMRFENDIIAQFDCGFKAPFRTQIEIVGTEGVLTVPFPFKPGIKNEIRLMRGGLEETIKIKGSELYLGEVEDMYNAVLNGTQPRVSLGDSLGNTAAILALIRSAETKRPVLL